MRRFLLLFAAVFLSLSAVAEVTTLASWTFTSSSYPANKTAFAATDGTCLESTFYLDGTGSTWSSSKGYAFTAVTSITLTLRTTVAIPSNTVISFAADMFYNKSSNAPAKGYDLTVSENGGTATTTGLDVTSISLSDSKATKTVNYTTQTNLAVGATIELIYTQTGMVGSGQAYFGNIVISTEAELSGIDLLSFDESSVELYLDEKDTFTPPILSNADGLTINWESSDENVATVDDSGNVSIVGIGTTKITATEKENSSNSASYTITVKDPNAIEDDVIVHGIFDGNAGGAYANEGSYTSGNGIIYKAKYSNTNGIQLNKNNASPGIVVTENPHGYVISKIIVEWNLNCAADKDLEIIGSNEAFTGTTDLNATAVGATVKKGTLLGTLKSVNETEFDVLATGYYCYIGLRALAVVNINKITLVWTRVEPEFKAEITIAVDETEGDANKITFSGLQESHGLAFDLSGYSVYLNGTYLGGYDETLSYLPFVPTGSFTISNGTYTYPVAVTWPITDFSTIKAKVADAGVEYWANQDAEHKVDDNMWYLDAVYTIAPDCEVSNLYFEMTCTINKEDGEGKIVKVDGKKVEVGNVGFFMFENGEYSYTTMADGSFKVTLTFPFYVKTALKGMMMLPAETEKVTSYVGTETLIDVTEEAGQVPQPNGAEGGNVSGVESLVVDSEGAVEYYNLQGVRVQGTLTPGIYIRRTATGTSKVAIR